MATTYIEKPKDYTMINPSFVVLIQKPGGQSSSWKSRMLVAVSISIIVSVSFCVGLMLYLNKNLNHDGIILPIYPNAVDRQSRNLIHTYAIIKDFTRINPEFSTEKLTKENVLGKDATQQLGQFTSSNEMTATSNATKIWNKHNSIIKSIITLEAFETDTFCNKLKLPESNNAMVLFGGRTHHKQLDKSIQILGAAGCTRLPR